MIATKESESVTEQVKLSIKNLTDKSDKTLNEIIKIKNPNETIFNLIKIFLMIVHNKIDYQKVQKWTEFQTELRNTTQIKNLLRELLNTEINKEIIEESKKCITNYNEIKTFLSKLNKNLLTLFEFIKQYIEYNIRRSICKSIHEENLIKNSKLKKLKEDLEEKEIIAEDGAIALKEMHKDFKLILKNSNRIHQYIIIKYNFLTKYEIQVEEQNFSGSNNIFSNMNGERSSRKSEKPVKSVNIRLKGKYKNNIAFVKSIINKENIELDSFMTTTSGFNLGTLITPKSLEGKSINTNNKIKEIKGFKSLFASADNKNSCNTYINDNANTDRTSSTKYNLNSSDKNEQMKQMINLKNNLIATNTLNSLNPVPVPLFTTESPNPQSQVHNQALLFQNIKSRNNKTFLQNPKSFKCIT